jgi:hypothetical protein
MQRQLPTYSGFESRKQISNTPPQQSFPFLSRGHIPKGLNNHTLYPKENADMFIMTAGDYIAHAREDIKEARPDKETSEGYERDVTSLLGEVTEHGWDEGGRNIGQEQH